MSKKLIVNGDDFGSDKDRTDAIIFAHKYGLLSSTTVMTERHAFDYAAKIIKENPNLKTGLHIDLDQIFLMDVPKGFFKRLVKVTPYMKEQIKVAINKQLDKFLKAGFTLSHFDSHHHAHMHPEVFPIVAKKAKELNVPVRFCRKYYCGRSYRWIEQEILIPILKELDLRYNQAFSNQFILTDDYEVGEVMLHPSFLDKSGAFELAKCVSPDLKNQIKENNIEIISFADLK